MSWGFGDDWIWQFRKVDDRIHVVRRNVRFTADKGDPRSRPSNWPTPTACCSACRSSPISPSGGDVVDLTPVFMSDLPQISHVLPGFIFSETKIDLGRRFPRAFTDNIELEVAATYCLERHDRHRLRGRQPRRDDQRALLDQPAAADRLPAAAGRRPRRLLPHRGQGLVEEGRRRPLRALHQSLGSAEGRSVGRAVAAQEADHLLARKDRSLQVSQADSRGHLEWNKAFEKAGFVNAIEVRQQPDNDDWDPEDINYNTFRWITAGAGFAMGPSRVNPHDRPDSRRRHHLRRRLPAVLEAGVRDLHARGASPR